jgi:hypothetical protein
MEYLHRPLNYVEEPIGKASFKREQEVTPRHGASNKPHGHQTRTV